MNNKTDYLKIGRDSFDKFIYSTHNAERIQKELLEKLLKKNAHTAYGQKYGFADICSFKEYQSRVPLSTYEDYEPYIEKLLKGEEKQLTAADPVYYCITSGSIGEPKYQPLTEADIAVHYDYAYGAIFGIIKNHYPDLTSDELFGRIFQVGEFARTFDESGIMNGIRSSSLYQWLDRDGEFDTSDYCVPKEVLFPDRLEDLTYIRARFALADSEITAVHGVFVHRMTEMLRYIENNWEILLRDMETGEIAPNVSIRDEWKTKLKEWLSPDPQRAAELRAIPKKDLAKGMIKKLWKKTRYVLCIGGSSFPEYMNMLEEYAKDIPIHYFAYAATEGIFGIAAEMNLPDSYVLLPDAGVFEFLPLCGGKNISPLSLTRLNVGEDYELIFTSLSGLYRYRMFDVIKVIGFYGESPVIKFCYRINQMLNIADEKTNMEQMLKAIAEFSQENGLELSNWCVGEDHSIHPARYKIYLECDAVSDASQKMDNCLKRCSIGYSGCRDMNEISAPIVYFVPSGSFAKYEREFEAGDRETGQIKPLRLLNTEPRQKYFADLMKGC